MSNSENPLYTLSGPKQEQIAKWMLNGLPYHHVNTLVEKEFSLAPVADLKHYSAFWEEICVPSLKAWRKKLVGLADDLARDAERSPAKFTAVTLDRIEQRALELSYAPDADIKELQATVVLIFKCREQLFAREEQAFKQQKHEEELELKERKTRVDEAKLKLLQEKAEAFDRAQAALSTAKESKGGITPETMAKIVSELNLM